jgi:hypothetical protein
MRFALLCLVAFAITATAGQPTPKPSPSEQDAIAAVRALGGKAETDPRLSAEARVFAKFENATDATLAGLKKLPLVGAVEVFDASKCTDKGFAALKTLPHLHKLVVEKADLTPRTLAAIGACKDLRHLGLVNCGVSDNELAGLKDLTRLEHLALSDNPRITDRGMATVKGFDRLRVLYLSKTAITDKGLAELKVLDGLRTLSVKGTRVTPDAAEKFPEDMPNLRKVLW